MFDNLYPDDLKKNATSALQHGWLGIREAKYLLGMDKMGADQMKARKLAERLREDLPWYPGSGLGCDARPISSARGMGEEHLPATRWPAPNIWSTPLAP